MLLEAVLGCTEMSAVLTVLGETGVIIQPVVLQGIWHRELLAALLAGQGLVVVFLHVETEHPDSGVGQVAGDAPHDVPVLQFLCLEALVGVVVLLRSAGRQLMRSVVSLQGLVDLELALAPVTLVVPLRDTWLLPVC